MARQSMTSKVKLLKCWCWEPKKNSKTRSTKSTILIRSRFLVLAIKPTIRIKHTWSGSFSLFCYLQSWWWASTLSCGWRTQVKRIFPIL